MTKKQDTITPDDVRVGRYIEIKVFVPRCITLLEKGNRKFVVDADGKTPLMSGVDIFLMVNALRKREGLKPKKSEKWLPHHWLKQGFIKHYMVKDAKGNDQPMTYSRTPLYLIPQEDEEWIYQN